MAPDGPDSSLGGAAMDPDRMRLVALRAAIGGIALNRILARTAI